MEAEVSYVVEEGVKGWLAERGLLSVQIGILEKSVVLSFYMSVRHRVLV